METRTCKKCGGTFPLTAEHYGHTPSGGYRHTCRRCMANHVRMHQLDNPEQHALRKLERQLRSEVFGSKVDTALAEHVRTDAKGRCFYCGAHTTAGHVDHMVPVVQGGSSNRANLAYACMPCNQAKHAKNAVEFFEYRVRLGLPVSGPFQHWVSANRHR